MCRDTWLVSSCEKGLALSACLGELQCCAVQCCAGGLQMLCSTSSCVGSAYGSIFKWFVVMQSAWAPAARNFQCAGLMCRRMWLVSSREGLVGKHQQLVRSAPACQCQMLCCAVRVTHKCCQAHPAVLSQPFAAVSGDVQRRKALRPRPPGVSGMQG